MTELKLVLNDFTEQMKLADEPVKALIEEFDRAYNAGDHEVAMRILATIQAIMKPGKEIKPVSAEEYLLKDPPPPIQILKDTFDNGDKIGIIGGSKQKKSFFMIQMSLCLAASRDFLIWKNCRSRRVLLVQFELKEGHYHRRIRNMAEALDISEDDLKDNLKIINARGLGINGAAGILKLSAIAKEHGAELIIFDPLYKLMDGAENSPEAFRPILDAFDSLAEETGAAICYVHHDAKGVAGDRDIRDRGAGSNVLGRDYDACLALSAHRTEKNVTVVETLVRNYRSRPDFCIEWVEISSAAACFFPTSDADPIKETAASKRKSINLKRPIPSYEAAALELVENNPLPTSVFKSNLRQKLQMTVVEANTFIDWATDPQTGKLVIYEERSKGRHVKLIGLPDQIKQLSAGGRA